MLYSLKVVLSIYYFLEIPLSTSLWEGFHVNLRLYFYLYLTLYVFYIWLPKLYYLLLSSAVFVGHFLFFPLSIDRSFRSLFLATLDCNLDNAVRSILLIIAITSGCLHSDIWSHQLLKSHKRDYLPPSVTDLVCSHFNYLFIYILGLSTIHVPHDFREAILVTIQFVKCFLPFPLTDRTRNYAAKLTDHNSCRVTASVNTNTNIVTHV